MKSESQKTLEDISPEVRRCYDTIFRGRKKIEDLKKEEADIYNDTKVAQDLLTLILRYKYESSGFVKGVGVIYKGEKCVLDTIFFDTESLMMQAIINPAPKKLFEKVFVENLKLVK